MATLHALAAKSLTFAKLHADDLNRIETTEKTLQKQIDREHRAPPTGTIAKIRYHGEKIIHSKHVLLAVVALNIIDCILVMGELMLDLNYVIGMMETDQLKATSFMNGMISNYPNDLQNLDDISQLYEKLLRSNVDWENYNATSSLVTNIREKRDVQIVGPSNQTTYAPSLSNDDQEILSVEEKVAYIFHKSSIAILSVLLAETFFKMFCMGKHMLEHKLEVFDAFVVIVSFILDIVFIKGLKAYSVKDFVVILGVLLSWRILRVVNSMIVAILDQEHFRMKLLYIQKKKITTQVAELRNDLQTYKKCIENFDQLCRTSGIDEGKILICEAGVKGIKKHLGSQSSTSTFNGSTASLSSKPGSVISFDPQIVQAKTGVDWKQEHGSST